MVEELFAPAREAIYWNSVSKRLSEIIAKAPELGEYIRFETVCIDEECVDDEVVCDCRSFYTKPVGSIPLEVLRSVASRLSVEDVKFLASHHLIDGVRIDTYPYRYAIRENAKCETTTYVIHGVIPYDEIDFSYYAYAKETVECRDGAVTLYRVVRIDSIPPSEVSKCLENMVGKRYFPDFLADLARYAEPEKVRELARSHIHEIPESILRKLVEAGYLSSDTVLEELVRRAEEEVRYRNESAPRDLEERRKSYERREELLKRLVHTAKSLINELAARIGDVAIIETEPPLDKLKIVYEPIPICTEYGYEIDEQKLRYRVVCRRSIELRYPKLVVEGRESDEFGVHDIAVRVRTKGYLRRSEFQRFLETVKRYLGFDPEKKVWIAKVTLMMDEIRIEKPNHRRDRKRRKRSSAEVDVDLDPDYL